MMELAVVMSNGLEITADDISYTSKRSDEAFINEEKTLRQYTCDIIKYFLKNTTMMSSRLQIIGYRQVDDL
jgi:hypothetical protein